MSASAAIDVAAYFDRIRYAGETQPTVDTLRGLHSAHVTHIPFENLDVLLGRPIRLDLDSLQAKLVSAKRGGYCFEQNALFAAVLEHLGFAVTRLAARVQLGTTRVLPRTHMLLSVVVEGSPWIADVGFGGWGLLEAIRLVVDCESRQGVCTYRLRHEAASWVLQCLQPGGWEDQYAFTLEPQLPVDYEPANYFCSTHPESRFVQMLTAQLAGPAARCILRNRDYTVVDATGEHAETITSDEAILRLLADRFDLVFPSGTVFRPLNENR